MQAMSHRRQSWGVGGSGPPDFGLRGLGRVVKYYYILSWHRKYVRKWWLLKSNRTIYPGIAVNIQFLPGKSRFLGKLPWKIEIFCEITWKNRNFSEICPEKSIFCEIAWKNRKFSYKIEIFLTRIHDPQISNQIDAAAMSRQNRHQMNEEVSSNCKQRPKTFCGDRLIDRLASWLTDWPIDWQIDWPIDWPNDGPNDRSASNDERWWILGRAWLLSLAVALSSFSPTGGSVIQTI